MWAFYFFINHRHPCGALLHDSIPVRAALAPGRVPVPGGGRRRLDSAWIVVANGLIHNLDGKSAQMCSGFVDDKWWIERCISCPCHAHVHFAPALEVVQALEVANEAWDQIRCGIWAWWVPVSSWCELQDHCWRWSSVDNSHNGCQGGNPLTMALWRSTASCRVQPLNLSIWTARLS